MKKILSLSVFLLIVTACKKKQPDFNVPMSISVYEELNFNSRQVVLVLQTENSITCGSSVLQGESSVSGSEVILTVSGMVSPPNCKYAPRRVDKSFGLGNLAEGVYSLKVKNGNRLSTGTLTIAEQKVSITFEKLDNLSVSDSVCSRIPSGTIWGNVMYAATSNVTIADSFTNDLAQRGAMALTLPDGEYHYFTIRSGTLTVAYNGVNLFLYRKDFLYNYGGISDSLQRMVSDYAYLHPQSNFFIRTWDGRSYNYPGPPVSSL
ncbi:MAG: hypothetical protein KF744_08760 [Taibaiella sp.]|nr:hypothetical protein [Taibaiella sp.]